MTNNIVPPADALAPPGLFTLTTVLSLLSTVALLAAAYTLSLRLLPSQTTPLRRRILFIWHAYDSLVHLTLEASFLYNCFFVYTTALPNQSASLGAAPAKNFLAALFRTNPPAAPGPGRSGLGVSASGLPSFTAPGVSFLADPTRQYGAFYGSGPTSLLWQEYARADRRWGGADLTVISLELLTVFCAGPLAGYVCYLLAKTYGSGARDEVPTGGVATGTAVTKKGATTRAATVKAVRRTGAAEAALWFSVIVLATGELYGGFMTFAPEWLSGNVNLDTSNWMFLWLYLFFFNMLWVVFPFWALREAYVAVKDAFVVPRE